MDLATTILASLLFSASLPGASVTGVVRDAESGAPLAGVVVSFADLERTAFTDPEGRYLFSGIAPGPQHVSARRIGYEPQTFHALVPSRGTLEIDVALRPHPIELSPIDVRAPVPISGLEGSGPSAFPDRGFSMGAARNHPLLSEPDALEATGGGEVSLSPESPSGLHIRGGASDQVVYLLDGFPVFSPYRSGGTFSAWNPDAIARLEVTSAFASPETPDALSGIVAATTLAPGGRWRWQGGMSTTQARVTMDGPLSNTGAHVLASWRSPFPGLLVHKNEASHVQGESGDWLMKADCPCLGGTLRGLGAGSTNELDFAVRGEEALPTNATNQPRSELEWDNASFGAEWSRELPGAAFRVRAWSARSDAGALLVGSDSSTADERLTSKRRDLGVAGVFELGPDGRSAVGVRIQGSETLYEIQPLEGDGAPFKLSAETPVSAAFVRHEQPLAAHVALRLSVSGAYAVDRMHAGPSAEIRWNVRPTLTLSASALRRHQFEQSLRNPESVLGNIFPADLFVGASPGGVPAARSDLAVVAVEHRPTAALRWGLQAYARTFDALALVAPAGLDPFATSGFVKGSGDASGLALEAGANGARFGALAHYGLQRVRLEAAGENYIPEFNATHALEGGVTYFPTVTSSIRLGAKSLLGRRSTAFLGGFEWESCNLLDQGCEFIGVPREQSGSLGGTRLPPYLRVDLGVRKHWHLPLGTRDAEIAFFGTVTNLLGRKNVLTEAVDPVTGARTRIEMRPRSPLVFGVDCKF